MGAEGYLALAALIVVLIPIVVLPMDGRRSPHMAYAVMAGCGLAYSAWAGGWLGLVVSFLSACGVVLAVGGLLTFLRRRMRLSILTGGHIKLMGAGAAWLGPWGALLMVTISIVMLFAIAVLQNMRNSNARQFSLASIAFSILFVAMQQNVTV